MIDKLDFVNNNGRIWHFNTDTCPLKDFSPSAEIRKTERPHMQNHGGWPSFAYVGRLLIHIEGDLLYNTPEDYIAGRLQMLATILPPSGRQKDRDWGKLILRYSGQTEDFVAEQVTLDGYPEIPMQALYPSTTAFMIPFVSFQPFLTGAVTGKEYWI